MTPDVSAAGTNSDDAGFSVAAVLIAMTVKVIHLEP